MNVISKHTRAAAPTDIVNSSVSYTLPSNVESLSLTGTSSINATGNELANVLTGNAGDNVIDGLGGDDTLDGGLGNDSLNGGTGNDVLTGGAGSDIFRFNSSAIAANTDRITDFNVADDEIRLQNGVFTALTATGTLAQSAFHIGSAAVDSSDRVIYNKTAGIILYDADGSGSGTSVQITTIGVNLAITNADFVVV